VAAKFFDISRPGVDPMLTATVSEQGFVYLHSRYEDGHERSVTVIASYEIDALAAVVSEAKRQRRRTARKEARREQRKHLRDISADTCGQNSV
jgi:hypothetical protein